MLTLYHFEGSPFCWKVRIALAEKKVAYTPVVPVNRETDPAFRKLSPLGKVPILVLEDGTPVYESTIINEFLEERYPSPPLMPNDPADKARARMIEEIADAYLGPSLRKIFGARYRFERGKIYRRPEHDAALEEEGRKESAALLGFLDRELEGLDWFLTQFSLADIGMAPSLIRTSKLLELPLGEKWPSLAGWVDRMLARPSVSETAPAPYKVEETSS